MMKEYTRIFLRTSLIVLVNILVSTKYSALDEKFSTMLKVCKCASKHDTGHALRVFCELFRRISRCFTSAGFTALAWSESFFNQCVTFQLSFGTKLNLLD